MQTQWTVSSINPLKGKKIAVLGDIMVDRFVYGTVDRISPEAPIPVVRVEKRTSHLGGAGNVAANLLALGVTPLLIGRIGCDQGGEVFKEISTKLGISNKFIVEDNLPTTCKTRVIARSQQVVRFDEEVNEIPCAKTIDILRQNLMNVRKEADVIIISDYDKGIITKEILEIVNSLWSTGTILADPKPRPSIDYTGISGMTPNLDEAILMIEGESKPKTDEEAEELAIKLVGQFDLDYILLTRSENGITFCSCEGKVSHLKTLVQEIVDVSGAGDTVISVFAAGIAAKMALEEATHLAAIAGSVVVSKLGTATVSWEEIYTTWLEHEPLKATVAA